MCGHGSGRDPSTDRCPLEQTAVLILALFRLSHRGITGHRGRKELHPGIERGHAHKADCGALGRKSEHGKEEFLRICEVVRADIIKKERKDLNQLVGAPKTAPGFFF